MGIVTFDLDSTLADTRHRHGLIREDGSTDWEQYAMACSGDALVTACASLWQMLRPYHRIWVVSGRSSASEAFTAVWLASHNLEPDGVLLMPAGTNVSATDHGEYKVSRLQELAYNLNAPIDLHIDDHPPVFEACRRARIDCMIVMSPQAIAAWNGDVRSYV